MKRILYLIAFCMIFSSAAFAQSLNLSNYNISVWGNQWDEMGGSLDIMNTTANPIDVMVERVNNNLATGHSSYFCYNGECFDDNVNLSTLVQNIPGGATVSGSFIHYCKPLGNIGISHVSYCFYDNNNITDSVCITFTYSASAVGISEKATEGLISHPQPNPSDNFTTFSYSLSQNPQDYHLVVYNILGSKVAEQQFEAAEGLVVFPTKNLESGTYFYSLVYKNKVLNTGKLLVSHQ